VLFRASNGGLKKVDVFMTNTDYTQIEIKAEKDKY